MSSGHRRCLKAVLFSERTGNATDEADGATLLRSDKIIHVSSVMSAIGSGWTHRAGEAHVVSGRKGKLMARSRKMTLALRGHYFGTKIAEIRLAFAFAQFSRYIPFTPFPENKVL